MSDLKYDREFLTETQDELVQKVIKSCMIGFELENPPENVIYGLNFSETIEKWEALKAVDDGKTKKDLKKIDKEIKHMRGIYGNKIKVVFEIDSNLPKLIYMNIRIPLKIGYTDVSTWTGILDFPISEPFIYGRTSIFERHKGGTYLFAPFFGQSDRLTELIDGLFKKFPDSSLNELIESNLIINFLFEYCNTGQLRSNLELAREGLKSGLLSNFPLISNLNKNKKLKSSMERILHFGAVDTGIFKFKSKNDVSTILIPYKEATVFQISNYLSKFKNTCKAINNLTNYLHDSKLGL